MKTSTLVILAAGLGRRYGGTKQTAAVTPEGYTIVDFSLYDAFVAGIEKVVFIVRWDILEEVRAAFVPSIGTRAEVRFVCQDSFPAPERDRPWGTGHAILSASEAVDEPFWVINADDFYGRSTFLMMSYSDPSEMKMAAFRLGATLSEFGPVSRGQCDVDSGGFLRSVIERKGILRDNGGITCDDPAALLTPDTPVSMNFWGFTPEVFPVLESRFARFLEEHGNDPSAEFYITAAVNDAIHSGEIAVRVLRTEEKWVGVTYREDRRTAAGHFEALRSRGIYPGKLW